MRKIIILIFILNCINYCTKIDYDFLMREKDNDNSDIIKWFLPLLGNDSSKKIISNETISEISEGSQVELGITLSKAPSSSTKLLISTSHSSLQTNKTEIEFDSQNYNQEQMITLTAVEDTNNSNEQATIDFTADGYETLSFSVDIIDNDNSFILAYNSPSTMQEGSLASFRVKLSIQPKEDKIVSITSSDTSALQVTSSQAQFTPGNYSVEQTINISAPEDSDSTSETVYITLSAEGSASVNLPIKIIDNEIRPIFSVPEVLINEEETKTIGVSLSNDPGMSVEVHFQSITFYIKLALQPKMNTTVYLSFSDDIATVYPTSVTFTPSTYNQPKPLLITANSPSVDTDIVFFATAESM